MSEKEKEKKKGKRKGKKENQFIKNSIAPKFWKDPLSCLRQKERMVKKPKLKRGEQEEEEEAEQEGEEAGEEGESIQEGEEGKRKKIGIVFDEEGTGFSTKLDDITQIAGRAMDLQTFQPILEPFTTYVFTTISIPAEVEKLTNIKSYRKPGSVLKDAAKPSTAFINFLNWIKKCKEDEKADEVILYGHNISKYDLRLLIDEGFRQGQ